VFEYAVVEVVCPEMREKGFNSVILNEVTTITRRVEDFSTVAISKNSYIIIMQLETLKRFP